jgi:alpha-D-ribose 1-methylphosphonate 5-triphosphate diphosphatase PhnM
MTETILTNARLILDGELVHGSIAFNAAGIVGFDSTASAQPEAIDVDGDFIAPGLIEMHTDNMEKLSFHVRELSGRTQLQPPWRTMPRWSQLA